MARKNHKVTKKIATTNKLPRNSSVQRAPLELVPSSLELVQRYSLAVGEFVLWLRCWLQLLFMRLLLLLLFSSFSRTTVLSCHGVAALGFCHCCLFLLLFNGLTTRSLGAWRSLGEEIGWRAWIDIATQLARL